MKRVDLAPSPYRGEKEWNGNQSSGFQRALVYIAKPLHTNTFGKNKQQTASPYQGGILQYPQGTDERGFPKWAK